MATQFPLYRKANAETSYNLSLSSVDIGKTIGIDWFITPPKQKQNYLKLFFLSHSMKSSCKTVMIAVEKNTGNINYTTLKNFNYSIFN